MGNSNEGEITSIWRHQKKKKEETVFNVVITLADRTGEEERILSKQRCHEGRKS